MSPNQRRILKGLIHNFTRRDEAAYWQMVFPRADATLDLMQTKGYIEIRGDQLAITRVGREAYRKAEEDMLRYSSARFVKG